MIGPPHYRSLPRWSGERSQQKTEQTGQECPRSSRPTRRMWTERGVRTLLSAALSISAKMAWRKMPGQSGTNGGRSAHAPLDPRGACGRRGECGHSCPLHCRSLPRWRLPPLAKPPPACSSHHQRPWASPPSYPSWTGRGGRAGARACPGSQARDLPSNGHPHRRAR
jgi:hypothetical protein